MGPWIHGSAAGAAARAAAGAAAGAAASAAVCTLSRTSTGLPFEGSQTGPRRVPPALGLAQAAFASPCAPRCVQLAKTLCSTVPRAPQLRSECVFLLAQGRLTSICSAGTSVLRTPTLRERG